MKRLAIYSLLFDKKVFLKTFLLFFALSSFFTKAYAVVDFSAAIKSVSKDTLILNIKNNTTTSLNSITGNYNNVLIFDVKIVRDVDGETVSSQSFNSRGVEQKDITFKKLSSGTEYTVNLNVENNTTKETKKNSYKFKTQGQSDTKPTLPVDFLKDLTIVGNNSISLTIRNNSKNYFRISVDAKNIATGIIEETKNTIAPPDINTKLYFNQLSNNSVYDLIMSGLESGSTKVYQTVTYKDLRPSNQVSQNQTQSNTNNVTQQIGQGQQPNSNTENQQGANFVNQNSETSTQKIKKGDGTCKDGLDNSVGVDGNKDGVVDENEQNGDGKADYYGVDTNGDGILDLEPDPSCIAPEGTELADISNSNLISCYNFCTFADVLKTINKAITFLITTLFVPTLVIVFMTAGVKYILAQGDSKKIVNLKNLIKNILIGVLLILCSWLIVKVILSVLVKDSDSALQFLE